MDSKLMVMNYTMNRLYQSVGEAMNATIHINKPEMGSIFCKASTHVLEIVKSVLSIPVS